MSKRRQHANTGSSTHRASQPTLGNERALITQHLEEQVRTRGHKPARQTPSSESALHLAGKRTLAADTHLTVRADQPQALLSLVDSRCLRPSTFSPPAPT